MKVICYHVIFALIGFVSFAPRVGNAQQSEIATTGKGVSQIAPDRAKMYFSISTTARKSEDASTDNKKLYSNVVEALEEFGFSKNDICTSYFNVKPNYERDESGREGRKTGYIAKHSLWIETDDFTIIGSLIDAVLNSGATEINNIKYTSSHIDSLRHIALTEAVERARADAVTLAKAAGGELGKIIEIATSEAQRVRGIEHMRVGSARDPVSFVPEEITVSAVVLVRWEFIEKR